MPRSILQGRYLRMRQGEEYYETVLATDPVAYWPLWDTAGAAVNLVDIALNGTYNGCTLADRVGPDGNWCPRFDGNDWVNIYSLALQAVYIGTEGSMMIWVKPFNAALLTDGQWHRFFRMSDTTVHWHHLVKSNVNNQLRFRREAVGYNSERQPPITDTYWHCYMMTWSETLNEFHAYVDGVQFGATDTVGAWAGNPLNNAGCVIGAADNVGTQGWNGWLAHAVLWDRMLT